MDFNKRHFDQAVPSFRIGFFSLLFSVFVFLLFSCASVPLDVETNIPKGWTAPKAAAAEELIPGWEPYARGIEYFAGQIRSPKVKLWALKVDLTHPDIEIVINEPGWDLGYVYSTTVSRFVEFRDLVAGINANPFDPVSSKEGEPRVITGLAITNGVGISMADENFDALLIYDDGLGAIVNQGYLPNPEFIRHAVGGFHIVLADDAVPEELEGSRDRDSRSAVGLNILGDTLYFLTVEGSGATMEELGVILRQLGASNGLNLDGGGSTQMALRWPDGKVAAINTGSKRAVAVCLGIRLKKTEPEFDAETEIEPEPEE
jgi:hypothetical protein